MSKKKEIKHELKTFLDNLRDKTSMTFPINVYERKARCMARIWEPENIKNPDINRRCLFACNGDSDLCKKHSDKESRKKEKKIMWGGRINEYPPPDLIKNYSKRNKLNEESYNRRKIMTDLQIHGHDKFKDKRSLILSISNSEKKTDESSDNKSKDEKNIVLNKDNLYIKTLNFKITVSIYKNKNKYQYNSNMESKEIINLDESSDLMDDYPLNLDIVGRSNFQKALENAVKRIDNNLGSDLIDIVNDKLKLKKVVRNCLAEVGISPNELAIFEEKFACNELVKTIELNNTKKKEDNNQDNIVILKKDILNLDSIRFIDNNNNPYDLYYTSINNQTILINQNSKKVGILRDWIDDNDFVPKEYKTAENVVLSPLNKLPVFEIEISIKGSGFEPIAPGIYREYEYNEDMEVFIPTNQIIRN